MTGLFVIFPELVCSLISLCHPELVSGSYQLEVKALSWLDAEIILNVPYGSGNPLFAFTLCSQNFACGALLPPPCRLLLFVFRTRFTSFVRKSATFRKNFSVFTTFSLPLAFSAFRFASAYGEFAVQHDRFVTFFRTYSESFHRNY